MPRLCMARSDSIAAAHSVSYPISAALARSMPHGSQALSIASMMPMPGATKCLALFASSRSSDSSSVKLAW